ncbi:MAG TPA: site-2 protease family protein [Actinomycetota bacterium]|nr:site-2 protease family protein [Actinomycetota bacterium]
MFGRGWRIGSIGGVPITLDASWVWVAIPITYTLYVRVGLHHPHLDELEALGLALVAAVLFFGSVLAHELAHAAMARAKRLPVFGIRLLFWGGATETPADRGGPTVQLLVSAVGPASNGLLALLFWRLSLAAAEPFPPLAGVFGYTALVNAMVSGLNLLPGYPLDGGQILRALVWRATGSRTRGSRVAGWVGVAVGVALAGFGVLELRRGNAGFAIWLAFIGWFLIQAARGAEQRERLRERLSEGRAADAMGPPPPLVPAGIALTEALDRYLRGHEDEVFPVVEDGRLVGAVSFSSARRVGQEDPLRPVRDALLPPDALRTVDVDAGLDQVAEIVGGGRPALVLSEGRPVGRIDAADLARWLSHAGEPRREGPGATPGDVGTRG